MNREKLYNMLEGDIKTNKSALYYDSFKMIAIIVSLAPLAMKTVPKAFEIIDIITAGIFIIDYILRLITADKHLKKGKWSFLLYPFTPMAIIDVLAISPSLSIFLHSFRMLKMFKFFRLFKTFRIIRAFEMFRYSKSLITLSSVIKKQRAPLLAALTFAVLYTVIAALVVFNIEPETFDSFFDAVFWATGCITTMGYEDVQPISAAGKVVTMISGFIGIAVVALPTVILTTGYIEELEKNKK